MLLTEMRKQFRNSYHHFASFPYEGRQKLRELSKWADDNLPKYPHVGEGCMGNPTYDERTLFCLTSDTPFAEDHGLTYIGFKTYEERDKFLVWMPNSKPVLETCPHCHHTL